MIAFVGRDRIHWIKDPYMWQGSNLRWTVPKTVASTIGLHMHAALRR